MKIAAISDTHGYLPTPPPCDVLIHAGDFTPATNHSRAFQKEWINNTFEKWLISSFYNGWENPDSDWKPTDIIAIAGNHDFIARSDEKLIRDLPWCYLKNESFEIKGIKFWGSPYSTTFGEWAFMREDERLAEIWETIPRDTNVLITHGPPYGFGDKVTYPRPDEDVHQGSKTLRAAMEFLPDLKLVLCGHIHEGAGVYDWRVPVANCSHVNLRYQPRQRFLEFEI